MGASIEFVKGLSMKERIALIMRLAAVVVGLILSLQGHPPAAGQERQVPADPTPAVQAVEDAYQDRDIAALKERVRENREYIARIDAVNVEQGKQLAGLSDRVNGFGTIITLLLTGSIAMQSTRKKKEASTES